MSDNNRPFEDLIDSLQSEGERIDPAVEDFAEVRRQLAALEGAISRYCDVSYPMPYKRPDDEVLDIAAGAVGAVQALIERL